MRTALTILGAALAVIGAFFALQGAGVIMWPADSFMLADRQWVTNGSLIAAAGLLLILLARQLARRGRR